MAKLALQAALWYNEALKYGWLGDVDSIPSRKHNLVGGYAMGILSPDSPDNNIPEKTCTKCGCTLPATNEFFALAKRSKDGLTSACKDCNSAAMRLKRPDARIRGKRTSQVNVPEGHWRCTICKNIFPATSEFFTRNRRTKSGLSWRCKSCKQQLDTDYRMLPETKERRKEYESTPKYKEAARIYHRSPKAMAHVRKYQKRPEIRQRLNVYQSERYHHPEIGKHIHALHNANGHTRRARKKAVGGTHTPEQIQEQLKRQHYRCYYAMCGHAKFKKSKGKYVYHVDHTFPIARVVGTDIPANDISYLVLACPHCNNSKNDKFPWEFPEGGRLL